MIKQSNFSNDNYVFHKFYLFILILTFFVVYGDKVGDEKSKHIFILQINSTSLNYIFILINYRKLF